MDQLQISAFAVHCQRRQRNYRIANGPAVICDCSNSLPATENQRPLGQRVGRAARSSLTV
jgi:hypothetical protein